MTATGPAPARVYDPDLERSLRHLPGQGRDARLNDMDIIRMMRDTVALRTAMGTTLASDDRVVTSDRTFAGPGGRSLPVRVYTPAAPADGPRPGVAFFHGGGYVMGDVLTEDERCLRLCAEADCVLVSLGYGLAPEEPHPTASEDGYAGLCWVAEQAGTLGIDPQRLAVAGSSAGGGLSAAVALLARDRGGPPLVFQLLVYPMLDDRLGTPSMTGSDDTLLFNRQAAADAWGHFLGGRPADQYAAPARAEDLTRLPPAYVMVAEHDPLRDEGMEYAQRLTQAGVATELHLFPGTFHGFDLVGLHTEVGQRAVAEQAEALRRALAAPVVAG